MSNLKEICPESCFPRNYLKSTTLSFVSKTSPYKAHITTNGSLVTGGVREKTPKICSSFAHNFVYDHFQQPQWEAQSVFWNLIRTVRKDWNFIYGVKVSYELNFAILLFRPDGGANDPQTVTLSFYSFLFCYTADFSNVISQLISVKFGMSIVPDKKTRWCTFQVNRTRCRDWTLSQKMIGKLYTSCVEIRFSLSDDTFSKFKNNSMSLM